MYRFLAVGLVAILVTGCETKPTKVVPKIGRIAGKFAYVKTYCEHRAATAESNLPDRLLKEGRDAYANAAAAHDQAITEIVVALATSDTQMSKARLKELLTSADNSTAVFLQWYESAMAEPADRRGAGALGSGADSAISLLTVATDLLKLRNEKHREERKALIKQLNNSRWRDWGPGVGSMSDNRLPARLYIQ
jgi:hypothetical protein